MLYFILGALVGTYFSNYTRPLFEKAFAFCKEKYEDYKQTKY